MVKNHGFPVKLFSQQNQSNNILLPSFAKACQHIGDTQHPGNAQHGLRGKGFRLALPKHFAKIGPWFAFSKCGVPKNSNLNLAWEDTPQDLEYTMVCPILELTVGKVGEKPAFFGFPILERINALDWVGESQQNVRESQQNVPATGMKSMGCRNPTGSSNKTSVMLIFQRKTGCYTSWYYWTGKISKEIFHSDRHFLLGPCHVHQIVQCEAPNVISWFINPSNYRYKYHKP